MKRGLAALAVLALFAAACGDSAGSPDRLVLVTHDSFDVSTDLLDAFAEEHGVAVSILRSGDAGTMVNQLVLTKDAPLGDVAFGVDNTFLSRALDAGVFAPHRSALLEDVPPELRLDPEHRVTPIDFGDVCLNYDIAGLEAAGLAVPRSLEDLTDPAYRGTLVVEDPATSSPGLAFLMATIARFPEGSAYTWQDFWADLRANDVEVTAGWEEAYFGSFSGGGEGNRPLVVSYASSPPAEAIFAEAPVDTVGTGVILDGCFRQIEFAGVLEGAAAPDLAAKFVDFMLSREFQEDIPARMFVFPANREAALPDAFVRFTRVPDDPVTLDPATIEANREEWIEQWTAIVLR